MLKWRNICGEILVRLIYVVYFCRKYTKIVVGQGLMSCTNQSEHLLIKIESFFMRKMEYVSPGIEVLSLYTDEMMGVPIRPGSTFSGTLDPGDDEPDPEEGND